MKKLFSVLLAICMVLAMSINVFADEMKEVYFESANRTPNDLGVGADVPWDGFGIGCIVNDHGLIENVTLADVIEQAKNGGILVMKFLLQVAGVPLPALKFSLTVGKTKKPIRYCLISLIILTEHIPHMLTCPKC